MNTTLPGRVKDYLRKPYPHLHNRWIIVVLIPLFVSLFMVTFQPFGLQSMIRDNKSLLQVGYGLVTFAVLIVDMYLLPLILPKLFSEERWLVISELLYLVWIVLTISAGNYLYSVQFSIVTWNGLNGLLIFIAYTFAIGIIPIVGIIVISHNYLLRKNLAGADEIGRLITEKKGIENREEQIRLESENRHQFIETTAYQLLCIESEGNYLNIWCVEDGKIVSHVIRNTLKNVEEQVANAPGLFRCHRAYIVNLRYVEHADGNSQGYRIKVKYLQKLIPVSRNYTKEFNNAFRNWE